MDTQLLCFISKVLNKSLSNIPKSHLVPLRRVSYWQIEPWLRKKKVLQDGLEGNDEKLLLSDHPQGQAEQPAQSSSFWGGTGNGPGSAGSLVLKPDWTYFHTPSLLNRPGNNCIRAKTNSNWENYVIVTQSPGSASSLSKLQGPGSAASPKPWW